MVQLVGGFWYNSGGFKYTFGVSQDILSGFVRRFLGFFLVSSGIERSVGAQAGY